MKVELDEVGCVVSSFGGLWPLPAAGAPPKGSKQQQQPTIPIQQMISLRVK